MAQNTENIWTYSTSRSSKVNVIDFGTNQKHICNFLLVRHSNLGHILYRFWDTAIFYGDLGNFLRRLIGWKLHIFPIHLIWRPYSLCSLSNFVVQLTMRKLVTVHDPNFNCFGLTHPCDRQPDGRTGDSIQRAIAYMLSKICYSIYTMSQKKTSHSNFRHNFANFLGPGAVVLGVWVRCHRVKVVYFTPRL